LKHEQFHKLMYKMRELFHGHFRRNFILERVRLLQVE
jgi:hypothetical protein